MISVTALNFQYCLHKKTTHVPAPHPLKARGGVLHQSQVRGPEVRAAAVGRGAATQGGVPEQAGEEAEQQLRASATQTTAAHPQAQSRRQRLPPVRSVT